VIITADFRSGLKLEVEGIPMEIIDYQHVKPGKGGAFVRTKMRNLRTGNVIERTYHRTSVEPGVALTSRWDRCERTWCS